MGQACCSDNITLKDRAGAPGDGEKIDPAGAPVLAVEFSENAAPPVPAPAAAMPVTAADGEEEDPFVSKVGELPSFGKKPANGPDQDAASEVSSQGQTDGMSELIEGMCAKDQKKEVKRIVKNFVKEMVKGQKMNVMTQNGQLKSCVCSLSRDLSALKVALGAQARRIELKDITEIQCGAEVEGIDTPLDDLCATIMMEGGDCITFRMSDLNNRDTFVMCLTNFCNNQ